MDKKQITRREFLYALGGAAAGAAFAGCTPATPQVVKETVEVQVESTVEVEKEIRVEKVVTATPGPAEEVELIYSTWRPLPEQELVSQTIADKFTAAHPNIKVSVIGASYGEYYKKIVTMAAGGTPVDVIHTDSLWTAPWGGEGLLVDILPYLDSSPTLGNEDLFWPGLHPMCKWEGAMYGLPFGISVMALYYNTDVFDEVGVEYPNESWGPYDIVDMAAEFTAAGKYGIDRWTGWVVLEWVVSFFGGKTVDDDFNPTKCLLDQDAAIESIEWWAALMEHSPVTPEGTEFYQKRSAMKFMWGSQVVPNRMNMEDENWDLFPSNLLSPVPLDEQALKIGLHTQNIGAATRHMDEAWALFEWLYTDYQPIWAREFGYAVPAFKEVARSDDYIQPDKPPKNMSALLDMMETGKAPWIIHPRVEEIHSVMTQEWDRVFTGSASAAEVNAELAAKVDELLSA